MTPIRLTTRQWQIVELMRECLGYKEIAERMGITYDSLKIYISHMWARFPAAGDRRTQAVLMMERGGQLVLEHAKGRRPAPEANARRETLQDEAAGAARAAAIIRPARPNKLRPDEERWNRIFDEKLKDPDYYGHLSVRRRSPFA